MRIVPGIFLLAIFLSACDEARVYEDNRDYDERQWLVKDTAAFEFEISDTSQRYNLYFNIRNSIAYPYSRLFVNYHLEDSSGGALQKKLIHAFLFDRETGKPFGSSGLGDIYDQQIPLLNKYQFPYPGKYKMQFEHDMRVDTLPGILAVGLRVERDF